MYREAMRDVWVGRAGHPRLAETPDRVKASDRRDVGTVSLVRGCSEGIEPSCSRATAIQENRDGRTLSDPLRRRADAGPCVAGRGAALAAKFKLQDETARDLILGGAAECSSTV
jgi:hypothetical protein